MKNSQDDTVADAVLAMTYNFKKLEIHHRATHKGKRDFESHLIDLRMRLKEARRFVLDDDLTRALVRASNVQPDVLRKRLPLALLPFPSIWIEFNAKVRVEEQYFIGTSGPPDAELYKYGYLLTRTNNEQPAWTVEPFCYTSDKVTSPHIIMHGFRCRTPEYTTTDRKDSILYEVGETVWGYKGGHLPDDFKGLVWTAVNGVSWPVIYDKDDEPTKTFWRKAMMQAAQESRGDARFLVTTLAVINHTPIEYREVTQRGNRQVRLHNVPFLDHSVINIHAGRKNVVYLIDRTLRKAAVAHARHRAHEVRGHHRVIHKGTVEERTIWIKEHVRGDASMGWVRQTWSVQLSDAKEMLP